MAGADRGNPFPEASEREPARVAVRVMREPAPAEVAARLARSWRKASGWRSSAATSGSPSRSGISASRVSGAITPARAGGVGTFRNWNTVRRIGAALDATP